MALRVKHLRDSNKFHAIIIWIYIYDYGLGIRNIPYIPKLWISLSKEVSNSNFRQYGQMEQQRWEESEKRREEKKREDQRRARVRKKEDAGARKERKVANHCV